MLLFAFLVPLVSAALDAATRSEPFYLAVRSTNDTYNNKAVSACHQGALITSLCITDQEVNLTSAPPFALNTITTPSGILEFNAPTAPNNQTNETSTYFPMNFWWDVYTNVVMGFFQPLDAQQNIQPNQLMFAGEEGNELVMKGPVMNDTMAPNWRPSPANETVNRWYVCDTWAPAPYQRTSVVWGLGAAEPQNPSCVKVDVVKVTT